MWRKVGHTSSEPYFTEGSTAAAGAGSLHPKHKTVLTASHVCRQH